MAVRKLGVDAQAPADRYLFEALVRLHRAQAKERPTLVSNRLDATWSCHSSSYVATYVEFIHYVEPLYEVSRPTAPGHFDETPQR